MFKFRRHSAPPEGVLAAMTWSLFYRLDNEVPTDFHELRQFGSSLWAANGKVKTMGRSSVAEFASPQAAKDALVQRSSEIEARGYKRVRQGTHDPARIDFPLLTAEIRDGARRAFQAIRAAHPDETIRLFALGSDDSAMTIVHAAGILALGEPGDMDDESEIWCSAEWPHSEGDEFLDIAYRMILPCHRNDLPCSVEFDVLHAGLFEACVAAMEQLDREGFFGTGAVREEVVLLCQSEGAEDMEGSIARLNTPRVVGRLERWIKLCE
jgi:predicted DNA-binding WGR domain protein